MENLEEELFQEEKSNNTEKLNEKQRTILAVEGLSLIREGHELRKEMRESFDNAYKPTGTQTGILLGAMLGSVIGNAIVNSPGAEYVLDLILYGMTIYTVCFAYNAHKANRKSKKSLEDYSKKTDEWRQKIESLDRII